MSGWNTSDTAQHQPGIDHTIQCLLVWWSTTGSKEGAHEHIKHTPMSQQSQLSYEVYHVNFSERTWITDIENSQQRRQQNCLSSNQFWREHQGNRICIPGGRINSRQLQLPDWLISQMMGMCCGSFEAVWRLVIPIREWTGLPNWLPNKYDQLTNGYMELWQPFSTKKMNWKMSSVKWEPFCCHLNVLINGIAILVEIANGRHSHANGNSHVIGTSD